MKNRILSLAVLTAAFLSISAKEPGTVVVMSGAQDISIVDNGVPFLTISNMARREEAGWIATHFKPSTSPSQVSVIQTTADGRKWRAEWVEVPSGR